MARVSKKVIEINNKTEVNSFSIFRVNLQFSGRFQTYTSLKDIGKDYERFFCIE